MLTLVMYHVAHSNREKEVASKPHFVETVNSLNTSLLTVTHRFGSGVAP